MLSWMAETMIDPTRPAPTERLPRPAPARRTSSKRVFVVAGAAMIAVSLMVTAALIYVFVLHYEPTATRHLPSNVNLAFRVEATRLALFPPVRKHLLQLDKSPAREGSRAQRLKKETGLDVTDLRELIVGSVDGRGWVILLGGRIPRGRFVDGMGKLLRAEKITSFQRHGALLVGPGGVTLAQADDGTIIVATSTELATTALPASDPSEHLALREDAAVSFAVTKGALSGLASQPVMRSQSELLGAISGASGSLTLDSAPILRISADAAQGVDPAALQSKSTAAIGVLRLMWLLLPDRYGEKGALDSATVTATPSGIDLRVDWPYAGLERACDDLARLLGALPR